MNSHETGQGDETAKEPRPRSELADLTEQAMQAVAASVIEVSRRTGTPVIIWEDEQIKAVPVDVIEKRIDPPKSPE